MGRLGRLARRAPPGAVRRARLDDRRAPPAREALVLLRAGLRPAARAGRARRRRASRATRSSTTSIRTPRTRWTRLRRGGVTRRRGGQPARGRRGVARPSCSSRASSSPPPPSGASGSPTRRSSRASPSELRLRPSEIAYVGDRVDFDVLPAAAAGMFTVHLRRGPGASSRPPGTRRSPPTRSPRTSTKPSTRSSPSASSRSPPGRPCDEAWSTPRTVPTGSRRLDGRRARRGCGCPSPTRRASLGGPTS